MYYKKIFFLTICVSILTVAIFYTGTASFLLWYDYLQIFKKGYFIEEKFTEDFREQAKGIIDNMNFNNVILGTSVLRATSAHELDVLLGKGSQSINLSIGSANFYERSIILEYLLNQKKIKNIIYSFEFFSYSQKDKQQTHGVKWISLYDNDTTNDKYRYSDLNLILKSITSFFTNTNETVATLSFFENKNTAIHNKSYQKKFGGLDNILNNMGPREKKAFVTRVTETKNLLMNTIPNLTRIPSEEIEEYYKYINDNITRHVKNNPDTTFHILLVPLSRYYFAELRQTNPEKYLLHKKINKYMVTLSSQFSNLKIYGFENMNFLDDISNYADTVHYHKSKNSMMNYAIANKTHRLTINNIQDYLEKSDLLAQKYNIKQLYEEIQYILNKKI